MKSILRPTLSTSMVILFAMILLFLGLFSEVFDSRTPEVDLAQIYANPIPMEELRSLKSLRLTNKQGSFLLENTHPQFQLEGPWQMIEPQALRVKAEVIPKILETLNIIRVRNFHRLEPINISSFSLDNPTLTLNFITDKDKSYEVKLGLINPIDNSAYLGLSSQNQIYQIDPLEMGLEGFDLPQLVESKVLAVNSESLLSLEIYGANGLSLKLIKKNTQWLDQAGEQLNESKVARFFQRLEGVKSFSILENLTEEQLTHMQKIMATPTYSLKIITPQGQRLYVISEVKKGIPGMEIAQSNFFALSTEERKTFVLIEENQMKVLGQKAQELK
jgi:hypothetical protein